MLESNFSNLTYIQELFVLMPYKTIKDLPESIQAHLPKHAQEIYLAAFNNAWLQYKDPGDRRGKVSREEVAHKVAWAAVKHTYIKRGDKWVKKQPSS